MAGRRGRWTTTRQRRCPRSRRPSRVSALRHSALQAPPLPHRFAHIANIPRSLPSRSPRAVQPHCHIADSPRRPVLPLSRRLSAVFALTSPHRSLRAVPQGPPPPHPTRQAYLFHWARNVVLGPREERPLLTGLHIVADIACAVCHTGVGWTYLHAFEPSQKYKEGKVR
jgi:hypothetical protein